MDLVNEYLRAVSVLLPKAQRDDIIAELRDTILTSIEAREAELGRQLTDDEVEAVLREIGHPLVIAARYREGPQHVVGPTLYPYWAFAVKIGVVLQLAIGLIVLLVRTIGGDFPEAFGQAIGSAFTGVMIIVGLATIAAWLIERQGWQIDYLKTWRVRDLRLLDFAAWDLATMREWAARRSSSPRYAAKIEQFRSRRARRIHRSITGNALAAIAAGTVFVLLWTRVLPFDLVGNARDLQDLSIAMGPLAGLNWEAMREALFWPVLAYAGFIILRGVLGLAWPNAVRLHGLLEAISGAISLAFFAWVWTASPIAATVRVHSGSELALRIAQFNDNGLVPLAPILTIALLACAFSGVMVMLRGLWLMMVGGEWRGEDHVGAKI